MWATSCVNVSTVLVVNLVSSKHLPSSQEKYSLSSHLLITVFVNLTRYKILHSHSFLEYLKHIVPFSSGIKLYCQKKSDKNLIFFPS